MTFGLSGAAIAGIATAGIGLLTAGDEADAAQAAAQTQAGVSAEQIAVQREQIASQKEAQGLQLAQQKEQFAAIQKLLLPYVEGGEQGLTQQLNMLGLNGAEAQQKSIDAIAQGAQFGELAKQGENAILQNASATGNLRGGNTQAALGQFRPQLLQQLIDQQYGRLGGLVNVGQNAAAGVGNAGAANANANTNIIGAGVNAGAASANAISNLLGEQGAAIAGGQIAGGQAARGYGSAITGALGMFAGLGGKF